MQKCNCLTNEGIRCKKNAINGTNFCFIHTRKCSSIIGDIKDTKIIGDTKDTIIGNDNSKILPHYVYEPSPYFSHTVYDDENKINTYLNDMGGNCNPDRNNFNTGWYDWHKRIKPFLKKMCDILPLDKINGVFGPYTYTEFVVEDDIKIGIFGEQHDPSKYKNKLLDYNGVIPMHSFIKSILLTNILIPNKKYDFYLETPYINSENNKTRRYIEEINFSLHLLDREFEKCFQINKSFCEYNNLRSHYINIRNPDKKYMYTKDWNYSKNLIFDESINTPDTNYLAELIKNPLVEKQLKTNRYRDRILDFILLELNKIRQDLHVKLDKINQQPGKMDDARFIKLSSPRLKYMKSKLNLTMDIYTIGRLTKKNSIENQKNIIIYVGDAHAQVYRRFLSYINAKLVKKIDSVDDSPLLYFSDEDKNDMPLLFESRKPNDGVFKNVISFFKYKYNYFINKINNIPTYLYKNIFPKDKKKIRDR